MKKLQFLPLGGAGEIGMNLNLYGDGDQWIIVDMGVSFGDDVFSSIDVVMANPEFLIEKKDNILGLVLTHAHEDHIGAIPYIWPFLKCPIYATPFTAEMIVRKLAEVGYTEKNIPLHRVPLDGHIKLGDFDLEYVSLTHSIPEPSGLFIRTPLGNIFHTGDWKFDPEPLIGKKTDFDKLKKLGDEGVLALVGDSTNAMSEGRSESEAEVLKHLPELLEDCDGRIIVTCFASNLARFQTVAQLAKKAGREVVLAGKSLKRLKEIGTQLDYFKNVGEFHDEEALENIARDKTLIICTGSQGEPRAALTRAARGLHPRFFIDKGDRVIFSSKQIPGNESSIGQLHNNLVRRGAEVFTEHDHYVHVSGHPKREELREMFQMMKPKYAIPVHGELRHMLAHALLAEEEGVEKGMLVENGQLLEFNTKQEAEIIDQVDVGRWVSDEKRLIPREHTIFQNRRRMSYKGYIVLTCLLDRKNGHPISEPRLLAPGVFDVEEDEAVYEEIEKAAYHELSELAYDNLKLPTIEEKLRYRVKQVLSKHGVEKPFMEIQFLEV